MNTIVILVTLALPTVISISNAALCNPHRVKMTVHDEYSASELVKALNCSGGYFDVTWVGNVQIVAPYHVTNGTSLVIHGKNGASVTHHAEWVKSAFFHVDSASILTIRDVAVQGSSEMRKDAVYAADGAVVDLAGSTFNKKKTIAAEGETRPSAT